MSEKQQFLPPPVKWAQTDEKVYITIAVEDMKDPIIKIEKDSVYCKGVGGAESKTYEANIKLYGPVDPENSSSANRGRCVEIILAKDDCGEITYFWPSLTIDNVKYHWIKCDFSRFRDEEDSDDEQQRFDGSGGGGGGGIGGGEGDFPDMMRRLGGLNTDPDKKHVFDDLDDEEANDSDDETLPELEG